MHVLCAVDRDWRPADLAESILNGHTGNAAPRTQGVDPSEEHLLGERAYRI